MALTTKRIIALPSQTDPQEGDYLAIDNAGSGTHKIPVGRIGVEVDDTLTEAGKAADAKATGDALDEIRSQIEVTGTASGSIATFADGSDNPMKSCIVTIEPQQSGTGTPSPENVRQISGWESVNVNVSGKNLLPPYAASQTKNGVTFTINADGTITANGTATKATVLYLSANSDSWSSGQFILNGCPSGGSTTKYCLRMYHENATTYVTDVGSGITFSGEKQLTCALVIFSGTTVNNLVFSPMIRVATDTDPTYEPYNGTTTSVNLGRTVYGGDAEIVGGSLTVDRAMVTLDGTQSFISQGNLTNTKHYSYNVPNMSNSPSTYSADVISDKMPTIADNSDTVHINHRNADIHVWLPSDKTPSAWFADNPTAVVYPLATPQTYTLTGQEISTLLGENNVWADCGEVEVVYIRDLNIAINNLLNSNGTRSLGTMAMSAPAEATTEEQNDEQTDEPAEDDMR